jgi:hypothetical protein
MCRISTVARYAATPGWRYVEIRNFTKLSCCYSIVSGFPLLLRGVASVAHIRAEEIAECYSQSHKARMRAEHALDPQQKREPSAPGGALAYAGAQL